MSFEINKLSSLATLPQRATFGSAGYDLSSSVDIVVPKRGKQLVSTGLTMRIPDSCYGRIAPRSGLAWKKGIDVGAGVIDSDYKDEVKVILFNHSDDDFVVKIGDRIAQIILIPVLMLPVQSKTFVVPVVNIDKQRQGGFGSTDQAQPKFTDKGTDKFTDKGTEKPSKT